MSVQYWVAPDRWKNNLIIVCDDALIVASPQREVVGPIVDALQQGRVPAGALAQWPATPLDSILEVVSDVKEGDPCLTVRTGKRTVTYALSGRNLRDGVFAELAGRLGHRLSVREERQKSFTEIAWAAVFTVGIGFATWSFYAALRADEAIEISGERYRAVKQWIIDGLSKVGPNGTLAIGGVVTLLCAAHLVRTLRGGQPVTVLK